MKVFISWSGARSRAVAEALHDWLQRVIQAVEPFYTPYMEKGVKWSNEIDDALEGTRFGIVCLTPDNVNSTWIHFETGALSKTKDAVIWTFLHGLTAGDVPQPLGKFQHTIAEKSDVLKLLHSINGLLREVGTGALKDALLEEIFEETWSKLEIKLIEAEKLQKNNEIAGNVTEAKREEKDVLNEILEIVRNQQRQINSLQKGGLLSPKYKRISTNENDKEFIGIEFTIYAADESSSYIKNKITEFIHSFEKSGDIFTVSEIHNDFIVKMMFEYALNAFGIEDLKNIITKEFGGTNVSFKYIQVEKKIGGIRI